MVCRCPYVQLLLLLACASVCARGELPDALPASAALYERNCSGCSNGQSVSGCRCFSDNSGLDTGAGESRYFSAPMTFEDVNGANKILVGAMDAAFVLDYNLDQVMRIDWPTESAERSDCISFLTGATVETYMCRNHIRHFGVLNGRSPETLTLCGTYSFHRACTYVEVSELSASSPLTAPPGQYSIAPEGSVPSDPNVSYVELPRVLYDNGTDSVIINGVTIFTNTENYGVIGFNRLFVNQSKGMMDVIMRTDPIMKTRVSRPQRFVEIFGHNYGNGSERAADLDFVFVAFQEADSNSNWISRIARVCRNDVSSSVIGSGAKGNFVNNRDSPQFFPMTFVKARVSCGIPKQSNADLPHTFNRMRGFQLVSGSTFQRNVMYSQVGYGLFAEGGEVPTGSAVCVYQAERGMDGNNNNGLFDIFRRRYTHEGMSVDNPSGFNCSDGGLSRVTNSDYNVKSVIEPSMLQIGNPPLFLLDGVQLTRIQVDPRRPVIRDGAVEYQDVIFVSSDKGSIYKVFIGSDTQPVISERIELDGTEVFNLNFEGVNRKYLYSSTVNRVWRVDLSNCGRFRTCQDCVAVRDPYCAWTSGQCVELPMDVTSAEAASYMQAVDTGVNSGCPALEPSSSVPPTTPTVTESFTETVTVNATVTESETVTETTTAATATIIETSTETKTVASTTITAPAVFSSCPGDPVVITVGPVGTVGTGGLTTPQPESNTALVAVAVVGGLFIVAAVVLGSVLGAVVVVYVRDRRGRYGKENNESSPQLSPRRVLRASY